MMLLMRGEPVLDLTCQLADSIGLKVVLMAKEDRAVLAAEIPAVVAGLEHLALEGVHVLNLFQLKALSDRLKRTNGRLLDASGSV